MFFIVYTAKNTKIEIKLLVLRPNVHRLNRNVLIKKQRKDKVKNCETLITKQTNKKNRQTLT